MHAESEIHCSDLEKPTSILQRRNQKALKFLRAAMEFCAVDPVDGVFGSLQQAGDIDHAPELDIPLQNSPQCWDYVFITDKEILTLKEIDAQEHIGKDTNESIGESPQTHKDCKPTRPRQCSSYEALPSMPNQSSRHRTFEGEEYYTPLRTAQASATWQKAHSTAAQDQMAWPRTEDGRNPCPTRTASCPSSDRGPGGSPRIRPSSS